MREDLSGFDFWQVNMFNTRDISLFVPCLGNVNFMEMELEILCFLLLCCHIVLNS